LRVFGPFQTRFPVTRQVFWKVDQEKLPNNPEEREGSTSKRRRGRLDNLLVHAKRLNAHTCAILVANDMHSGRALIVIFEQSTIPVRVSIAASNGVAHTSTGITSRSNIP